MAAFQYEEFEALGDEPDLKLRAEILDEGLEVLTGLWSGEPCAHEGKHYHIKSAQFLPAPLQQPRIPVWVAGNWPIKAPFRRAARWDGCSICTGRPPLGPISRDQPATSARIS